MTGTPKQPRTPKKTKCFRAPEDWFAAIDDAVEILGCNRKEFIVAIAGAVAKTVVQDSDLFVAVTKANTFAYENPGYLAYIAAQAVLADAKRVAAKAAKAEGATKNARKKAS